MAVMVCAMIMTAIALVMLVMITAGVGIIGQRTGGERPGCLIRRTLHPGVEPDACVGQLHLCAHADAVADQRVHLGRLLETGQYTSKNA